MKMPKLNVKLLRRIKRHIKAEPKRYDQGVWIQKVNPDFSHTPACGTQACIAGWAVVLTSPNWRKYRFPDVISSDGFSSDIYTRAQKALGLTVEEANALFDTLPGEKQTGKRAVNKGCKRIDRLIELRKKQETVKSENEISTLDS